MTTTLRFPLKKYLRSSSMDSQHWSTFISPSMAATLEISHQTRDGDIARLSITITHDSGYVDTMVYRTIIVIIHISKISLGIYSVALRWERKSDDAIDIQR